MKITSPSFDHESTIPDEFAFGKPDPEQNSVFSDNRNPELRWSGAPDGTRSFALLCVDTEVPTVGDDVNQEGRTVPADLPRCDFTHWVMVDIPADCNGVGAGECSDGVTAGGKQDPGGPTGSRQGQNDYTGWFAGHEQMGGTYLGYDGPGPPWNDERMHRYHFRLYALDLDTVPVSGAFTGPEVMQAIEGHVLAEATLTGTYTQFPNLR